MEFEATMVYRASFNTAVPQRNTVLRDKNASGQGLVIYKQNLKKNKQAKPVVVAHAFFPCTWEAQTGESLWVQAQPGQACGSPTDKKKRRNIYRNKIIRCWWRAKAHEVHIQASTNLLEVFWAENPEFLFTQLGPQNCQIRQPIRIIGNSLICMERIAWWEMVGKGAHHNRKRTPSAWIFRDQQVDKHLGFS